MMGNTKNVMKILQKILAKSLLFFALLVSAVFTLGYTDQFVVAYKKCTTESLYLYGFLMVYSPLIIIFCLAVTYFWSKANTKKMIVFVFASMIILSLAYGSRLSPLCP
jgi:cytochrome bd-type quinol oxidase subunit 2